MLRSARTGLYLALSALLLSGCRDSEPLSVTNPGNGGIACSDESPASYFGTSPGVPEEPDARSFLLLDLWAEAVASRGNSVIAAGRASDWRSNELETPAVVMRVDPVSGKELVHTELTAEAVDVNFEGSTPGQGFDRISQIQATDSHLFVVWERVSAEGDTEDWTLVRLDPCDLKVLATAPLSEGVASQDADSLAFDDETETVWLATAKRLASFDAERLTPGATAELEFPNYSTTVAAAHGAIWVATQDQPLLRVDPSTGATVPVTGATSGSIQVSSTGGEVYMVDEHQTFRMKPNGDIDESFAIAVDGLTEALLVEDQVWVLVGTTGLTNLESSTAVDTGVRFLDAASSGTQIWLVDGSGVLYALV